MTAGSVLFVSMVALIILLVAYILWIKRTPGEQPGEAMLARLKAQFSEHVDDVVEAAEGAIDAARQAAVNAVHRAGQNPAAPAPPDAGEPPPAPAAPTSVVAPDIGGGTDPLEAIHAEIAKNAEEAVRLDTKLAKAKELQDALAAVLKG